MLTGRILLLAQQDTQSLILGRTLPFGNKHTASLGKKRILLPSIPPTLILLTTTTMIARTMLPSVAMSLTLMMVLIAATMLNPTVLLVETWR